MPTKIEWVTNPDGTKGETWNPVTGCTKISEGCRHCYAERMARRLAGRYGYSEAPHHFDVTLHPERLEQPLRWRKPRTVFVCSMSDLFHEDVPFVFIGKVFATIIAADQHTFQILTKRPDRMRDFVFWFQEKTALNLRSFRHVWLGVTAENQAAADERIPLLLQTPAAVRFVSVEPMLGAVDLSQSYADYLEGWDVEAVHVCGGDERACYRRCPEAQQYQTERLDWVIVGGESGPGARPMHPDWARSLRDQAQAAGVPFFFKQWGAWEPYCSDKHDHTFNWSGANDRVEFLTRDGFTGPHWKESITMLRVGKKTAGRLLDGRTWDEMPAAGAQRDRGGIGQ